MTDVSKAYRQRVERMSAAQRQELMSQLDNVDVQNAATAITNSVGPRRRKIVAYVVPSDAGVSTKSLTSVLRDTLRDRLPDHMVPDEIVTLDTLPRLPNGKVNPRALPDVASSPKDKASSFVAPRNDVEQTLADIWGELIGVPMVGVHDNFFEIGGDSIISIQAISRAREAGIAIEPRQFVERPTVAGLASVVSSNSPADEDKVPMTGDVPLLPIQHWFFERQLAAPEHWNMSSLFDVTSELDEDHLFDAISACLQHHDGLRARFTRTANGWRQAIVKADDLDPPLSVVDLTQFPPPDRDDTLQTHITETQTGLDLGEDLVRFVLFRRDVGIPDTLLIVVHHLVMDVFSWGIVLDDLEQTCEQLRCGQTVLLPKRTTSLGRWGNTLGEYADDPSTQAEMAFWQTHDATHAVSLPQDSDGVTEFTEADATSVRVALSADVMRSLLSEVHRAYNTQIMDLCVAALTQTFCEWCESSVFRLDLEGHGREPLTEEIDLSRTVGWLTSYYPIAFRLPQDPSPGKLIKDIKEQLRAIPRQGIGLGALRYLSSNPATAENLKAVTPAPVLFNYLGRLEGLGRSEGDRPSSLFVARPGAEASSRARNNQRSHTIEINAAIRDGSFTLRSTDGNCPSRHTRWLFHQRSACPCSCRFEDEPG